MTLLNHSQVYAFTNLHDAVVEYHLILDHCVSNMLEIIAKDRG